jgi:heme A synthase
VSALYPPVLVAHVLVAILGVGSIAAVALVAATGRRAGRGASDVSIWLRPLLRYSAFSLAGMLVTGALLDFAAGGAFHEAWWFRGSALLLLATGALNGRARRVVRRESANEEDAGKVLRRVERMAYAMCALIGAITVLMELKPF